MSEVNTPLQLNVCKARLTLVGERELLSAGMSGVVQVGFTFSSDWDGLHKIAVFSNGAHSVDVPEEDWQENVCTIPAQVLSMPGKTLMAGVYGSNGAHLVLPTVWCVLGRIEPGVQPAFFEAAPPDSSLWVSIQAQLDAAKDAVPLIVHAQAEEADGTALLVDCTLSELTAEAGEGRVILLELSGGYLLLQRLVPGVCAEFAGTVFQHEGSACYTLCTISPNGAECTTIPIAAAQAGSPATAANLPFIVTISHDSNYALQADATTAQLLAAHQEGKELRLIDLVGRQLLPEQMGENYVVFSGVSWFIPDDTFCLVSYIFDANGMHQQVLTLNEAFYNRNEINQLLSGSYYTRSQIDEALGSYITDIAQLVGGDA